MANASTAAVMAEYIRQTGTTSVFAYPGDPIIEFLEELRVREIDVVLGRREGTAAFMAEGYAMATGQPSVVISTLGPGSTALVNGVAAATWDRVPMLAISGQIDSAREQYFTHQVVDHKLLFGPVTKWAARVEPGAAATIMRRAYKTASSERPGAVHLTCAEDMFRATATDTDIVLPPTIASAAPIQVLSTERRMDPSEILRSARRPLILAGIAATRAGATTELTAFAETTGAPVVVAPMAKGVFDENHRQFAGVLDMACNDVVWDLLRRSDLIVAVGFDAVELIKPWTVDVPVLHIDATPNVDQIYRSDCEVVGDIPTALAWLAGVYSGQTDWTSAEIAKHVATLRDRYYSGRVGGALNPTDVVDSVLASLPEDTIAACDVGSHKLMIGQGWTARQPRQVLMTNGLSSMGFGLPAAIGAALARPERQVVALVGDGGFAMTCSELRLAASRELPLVVVVFADASLNRIELKQMARGYASTATRIEHTDIASLAASMECDGIRVDSQMELDKALSFSDELSRPLVIDARINPAQYEAQF